MPINSQVEERLRKAYSGAIAKDPDAVAGALDGISKEDTASLITMGLYVSGFVANDIYRDGPTDEDFRELASKISEKESDWIDLDRASVAEFLKVAVTGDVTLGGLGGEDVTGLAVVCGAHLLSYYRLDDQRWYQYLDEIWDSYEQITSDKA
ncbi:hypothetical protein GCM10023322_71840 [Rugosimonospora acidiphila]|uniref:Uncharacterized protein n=1 Tax=Rugosimonospora acidiphila TaxID=556531 RepID=A0ABP9SL30_9ACTN